MDFEQGLESTSPFHHFVDCTSEKAAEMSEIKSKTKHTLLLSLIEAL